MGLNLDHLPVFHSSSFRSFFPHERHVTRYCKEDVLVMVYDGILRFTENGHLIEVKAGEYYLQKHGLFQAGTVESECPQYYYIHFFGDFSPGKHPFPLSGKADFSSLFPLFRKLDQLRHANSSQLELNTVFYQILSHLHAPQTKTDSKEIVQKILGMFFANPEKHWSLEDFSSACGYCKNQIIKLFRQETGMTPYTYISLQRLNMAKQLLSTTNHSLQRISLECGFGSYINFYKEFVKAEGCSPTIWRKEQLFPEAFEGDM